MITNIRNLTAADLEDIDRVLMTAYGRPSSFKSELQLYLALQPDGWLIVECDRVPVGLVGAVDYGALAYIGLLCVHPDYQRRRIGQSLMEKILTWLDNRGCPHAVLNATEAARPLYTKLGFVEQEKSLVLQQETAVQHLSSYELVSKLRSTDLIALAAFDTPLFGADRHAVFAAFLKELSDRAFIAHDPTGKIIGYLFAQPQRLGPWAAITSTVAEALLTNVLQLSFDNTPYVLVPGSNQTAIALLKRYGFIEKRSLSHMHRGRSTVPGQGLMLYGMANFGLG